MKPKTFDLEKRLIKFVIKIDEIIENNIFDDYLIFVENEEDNFS